MKLFSTVKSEKGQGLVEYAVLLAFLVVTAMVGVKYLGTKSTCTYSSISNSLPGTSSSSTCSNSNSSGNSNSYATTLGQPNNNKNQAIDNFCEGVPEGTTYRLYKKSPNTYIAGGSATNLTSPFSLFSTGTCD